jgi:hypothetical protein
MYHSHLLITKNKMVKGVGVSSMSKIVSNTLYSQIKRFRKFSCCMSFLMLFLLCIDQPILGRWKTKSKRG